jgi:hypothetical protein
MSHEQVNDTPATSNVLAISATSKVYALQVGHIGRDNAAILSKLVDMHGVRLDGTIPHRSANTYTIPLEVHLYGSRAVHSVVVSSLARLPKARINPDLDGIITPERLSAAIRQQQKQSAYAIFTCCPPVISLATSSIYWFMQCKRTPLEA